MPRERAGQGDGREPAMTRIAHMVDLDDLVGGVPHRLRAIPPNSPRSTC